MCISFDSYNLKGLFMYVERLKKTGGEGGSNFDQFITTLIFLLNSFFLLTISAYSLSLYSAMEYFVLSSIGMEITREHTGSSLGLWNCGFVESCVWKKLTLVGRGQRTVTFY